MKYMPHDALVIYNTIDPNTPLDGYIIYPCQNTYVVVNTKHITTALGITTLSDLNTLSPTDIQHSCASYIPENPEPYWMTYENLTHFVLQRMNMLELGYN